MKVYLSCCPLATEHRLLLRLTDQQHFVDSHRKASSRIVYLLQILKNFLHLKLFLSDYTLNDLAEINSGRLIDFLTEVHADFARHIKLDCEKCQAKGFICEMCNSENVIFPFDALAISCDRCGAVFQ